MNHSWHFYGARVDVRPALEYPGFIRVVSFHPKNRVIVEFYACNNVQDAAFEFVCIYSSLELAIEAIEDYLGIPINSWTNHNKTGYFPSPPEEIDLEQLCLHSYQTLAYDIINGKLNLPRKGDFKSKHKLWESIEEFDARMKHILTSRWSVERDK
jgi:hypothetical protein